MTQPQQQFAMPQRTFSPPQNANSPAAPQQFGLPPNKRQRLSPNPSSQPGSPYPQYTMSSAPGATTPGSTGPSPVFAHARLPENAYSTPYSNGGSALSMPPQSQPNHSPAPQYNQFNFANSQHTAPRPDFNSYASPIQPGAGTMGPPSKPAEKPKEDGTDVMDVLGGTGVDLRKEEDLAYTMYNSSFNTQPSGSQSGTVSSSHSFSQFPPGDERSMFGAGPANAAGENANAISQEDFQKRVADKAWHDAATNLATSRQRELSNPFLEVERLHRRLLKISHENGLVLQTDGLGSMGKMMLPDQFPQRDIRIQAAVGPESAFMSTNGQFLPKDTMLVDQLALMSIATKQRLRILVEDAAKLAKGRQLGSHGLIPEDWADAAAPSSFDNLVSEGAVRSGWESAVSPRSNPFDRSLSNANKLPTPVSDVAKTPAVAPKLTNEIVVAMRASAGKERDIEEIRLRKRQARASGEGVSRQNSILPGTPGSVAPDPSDKSLTKKEAKKQKETKVNEAANHAAANTTTAQFLGGGGGLFGKKKKYSWMTGGGPGSSGASTPGRINTAPSGASNGGPVNAPPQALTAEGARRLGTWREDGAKGAGIQMRDWVTVLEEDGHEKKALQKAYLGLDKFD